MTMGMDIGNVTPVAGRELPIPELLLVVAVAFVYPGWFHQVSLEIHVVLIFEGALVLTAAYLHLIMRPREAGGRVVPSGKQDRRDDVSFLRSYDVLLLAIGACLVAYLFGGGSFLIPVFVGLSIHSMVLLAMTFWRRKGLHAVRVLTRIMLISLFLVFIVTWPLLAIAYMYGT
jgi:hypothetical protein